MRETVRCAVGPREVGLALYAEANADGKKKHNNNGKGVTAVTTVIQIHSSPFCNACWAGFDMSRDVCHPREKVKINKVVDKCVGQLVPPKVTGEAATQTCLRIAPPLHGPPKPLAETRGPDTDEGGSISDTDGLD